MTPDDEANRYRLVQLCDGLGVEPRTTEWFTSDAYAHLWPQMIHKIDELNRRRNGEVNVKNPAAWLTKFFNIIRVDPDEPARNRATRGTAKTTSVSSLTTKRSWLGDHEGHTAGPPRGGSSHFPSPPGLHHSGSSHFHYGSHRTGGRV